jgi:hypothetical protein
MFSSIKDDLVFIKHRLCIICDEHTSSNIDFLVADIKAQVAKIVEDNIHTFPMSPNIMTRCNESCPGYGDDLNENTLLQTYEPSDKI